MKYLYRIVYTVFILGVFAVIFQSFHHKPVHLVQASHVPNTPNYSSFSASDSSPNPGSNVNVTYKGNSYTGSIRIVVMRRNLGQSAPSRSICESNTSCYGSASMSMYSGSFASNDKWYILKDCSSNSCSGSFSTPTDIGYTYYFGANFYNNSPGTWKGNGDATITSGEDVACAWQGWLAVGDGGSPEWLYNGGSDPETCTQSTREVEPNQPTPTQANTPTPTKTNTPTPTKTKTPTPTPTKTPTSTKTPTPTSTKTPTPTDSPEYDLRIQVYKSCVCSGDYPSSAITNASIKGSSFNFSGQTYNATYGVGGSYKVDINNLQSGWQLTGSNTQTKNLSSSTLTSFDFLVTNVVPTNTPTPDPDATSTPTPTRTPTPTATATPTQVPSSTPTPTTDPDATPTPTPPSGDPAVFTIRGENRMLLWIPISYGGFVLDEDSDGICSDENLGLGSANYTGGGQVVLVNNRTGTIVNRSVTSPASNYQLSVNGLTGDNLTVEASVYDSNYRVTQYKYMGPTNSGGTWQDGRTLAITNADDGNHYTAFCVSDAKVAWFQTDVGDVRMPHIENDTDQQMSTVPPGFTETDRSIYFSTRDNGSYQSTKPRWQVNSEYNFNESSNYQGKLSYSYLERRALSLNVPTRGIPGSGCTQDASGKFSTGTCTINLSVVDGHLTDTEQNGVIYKHQGTLILNGFSNGSTNVLRATILVDGNINIRGKIFAPSGVNANRKVTIIAARGNIDIFGNVGGDPVADITAILTAERTGSADNGHIYISRPANAGCPTADLQLKVSGALIANAQSPFASTGGGQVKQLRNMCANNGTVPALIVKSRFQFVTSLTDFYRVSNHRWSEVQP